MNVLARPSYRKAARRMPADTQAAALVIARRLPEVFGRPHLHAGLGLRQFGIFYEFRVGLQVRVLFVIDSGDAVLVFIGNHNAVRAFLKGSR